MRWINCSRNCNLWSWEEMWRMFWVGKKIGMAFFLLDPSTAPSWGPLVILFLGVLFGGLGLQWGWVFFAWETSWNKILTINRLKRRGWNMPNRCYLCKKKEETSDHLILFCKKATMLWSLIFSLFDCSESYTPWLKGICLVGMEGCPSMLNVDFMEGKKWKSVQWYWTVWPSYKTFFFVYTCKLG